MSCSEHADSAGDALREDLTRIWSEGPELGIHVAIAAERIGAIPVALASLSQQRLAFQLADAADYAQLGISRRSLPRFWPGRAVVGGSGQVIQIARAAGPLGDAVASWARADRAHRGRRVGAGAAQARDTAHGGPAPVEVLPERLGLERLPAGITESEPWLLPLAIGDRALEPVGLELYEGEHALIAGPPRSGRTNALLVAAQMAARLYPETAVYAIAGRRSVLRDWPGLAALATGAGELAELVDQLRAREGRRLLLIDDADCLEDPTRALSELASGSEPGLHVIAAGRSDGLRGIAHWTAGLRRSRTGLLLMPDLQMDGALFGIALPRRPNPPQRPGCGDLVIAGAIELAQVAHAAPAGEGVAAAESAPSGA